MPTTSSPESLLTLSSIVVARYYPFALIEERYKNIIPEPVQKSIIIHSFPKRESDVLVYASSEFNAERYGVENVVQIGFHVSGVVFEVTPVPGIVKKGGLRGGSGSSSRRGSNDAASVAAVEIDDGGSGGGSGSSIISSSSSGGSSFKVSATFDRRKITSVSCNCENESSLIFWCDHVVALALYRIRRKVVGVDFVLRVPISETLLQLNRSQLQKLVQYLISDHTDVLPTVQYISDQILMKTSDNYINRIHGAPDITAGPSPSDPHAWALNESQIQSQVRVYVTTTTSQQQSSTSSSSQNVINTLIEKAYRMIKSRDSNATRIVQIITSELVRHVSRPQPRATIPPQIWDQIVRIWNVIVLKPGITDGERVDLRCMLEKLAGNEHVPGYEDADDDGDRDGGDVSLSNGDEHDRDEHEVEEEEEQKVPTKRQKIVASAATKYSSIFTYPLKLLECTVNPFDYECSVLHSRVCHGNEDASYALKLLENLKKKRTNKKKINKKQKYTEQQHHNPSSSTRIRIENAHVLFDVLKHSNPRQAYEAALIGLTCGVQLRPLAHLHEKHIKHVEKLLSKIHAMGNAYTDILASYATALLHQEEAPSSSFPPISFVTYAFNLLNSNVTYRLALKHLCLNSYAYVHTHVESQQIVLATTLLSSNKHNEQALEEISSTIIRVVNKSNTSLFRLAQECFKQASNDKLVNVAFNIALHVVRATKYTVHRRRWEMVRWVVSCGVEIGVEKLLFLVRNWGEYFSAVEAVGTVASNILAWVGGSGSGSGGSGGSGLGSGSGGVGTALVASSSTSASSGVSSTSNSIIIGGVQSSSNKMGSSVSSPVIVDKRVLEELANAARNLAIQCAKNDPQNCALNTLTLCETDPIAFETSYQIVLESASKEFLTPQQIFTIARYMEHRGYTQRAYRLAVIALQFVHIGYNQDTHSLISEIHWTCNLSHQLSTPLPMPPPPPPPPMPQAPLVPPPPATTTPSSSSLSMSTRSTRYQQQQQQQATQSSSSSSTRYYNSQQRHHHHNQHHSTHITPHHSHSHHHHHHHHHHQHNPPQQCSSSSSSSSSSSTSSVSSLPLTPPSTEIDNLIPLLIRNIKCATVLTEILRRSITILTSYENAYQNQKQPDRKNSNKLKLRVYEKLNLLIEGTIDSYITTIHSRLVHISPRHYSDFIEFVSKARENFLLAPNGAERFNRLMVSIKLIKSLRGKKKLLFLLNERFRCSSGSVGGSS